MINMKQTTRREVTEEKQSYLDNLMMCFQDKDMSVCYNYYKEGVKMFSKWINYWNLMHMDESEILSDMPIPITKKQFIDRVTHRSVLDVELMIDIDDDILFRGSYWEHKFHSIPMKAFYIMRHLDELGVRYSCYWTQSKSFHISVIVGWFRELSYNDRVLVKEQLLGLYGGDLQEKGKSMIAIEGEMHYRSCMKKVEVFR